MVVIVTGAGERTVCGENVICAGEWLFWPVALEVVTGVCVRTTGLHPEEAMGISSSMGGSTTLKKRSEGAGGKSGLGRFRTSARLDPDNEAAGVADARAEQSASEVVFGSGTQSRSLVLRAASSCQKLLSGHSLVTESNVSHPLSSTAGRGVRMGGAVCDGLRETTGVVTNGGGGLMEGFLFSFCDPVSLQERGVSDGKGTNEGAGQGFNRGVDGRGSVTASVSLGYTRRCERAEASYSVLRSLVRISHGLSTESGDFRFADDRVRVMVGGADAVWSSEDESGTFESLELRVCREDVRSLIKRRTDSNGRSLVSGGSLTRGSAVDRLRVL